MTTACNMDYGLVLIPEYNVLGTRQWVSIHDVQPSNMSFICVHQIKVLLQLTHSDSYTAQLINTTYGYAIILFSITIATSHENCGVYIFTASYMQALALASLKTWNPKERAGRKRVLLATCSSGFSSGREVLSTSCSR